MDLRVHDKFGIFQPSDPPSEVAPADLRGLTGCYIHRFGRGRRLYLPAPFRSLGPTLVLSAHPWGYLRVDAPILFARLLQSLAEGAETVPQTLALLRRLAGSATSVAVDSRGRFFLPESLYTEAEMKQEMVFVGRDDHAEAWTPERWEQHPSTG